MADPLLDPAMMAQNIENPTENTQASVSSGGSSDTGSGVKNGIVRIYDMVSGKFTDEMDTVDNNRVSVRLAYKIYSLDELLNLAEEANEFYYPKEKN